LIDHQEFVVRRLHKIRTRSD